MKIKLEDNKTILYLYNYFFKDENKKELEEEIKKIFIRLIKYYHLNISGFYDVIVYENQKYGSIIEIILKEQLLFRPEFIDIKVKLYKNCKMYFKTKDYFILNNYNNIYYQDNNYYLDINNINNFLNLMEFGDILYKEKDINLSNMILIK